MSSPWKDSDIERLRALFPTKAWRRLKLEFPGRTVGAIRQKAVCLGIVREINPRVPWFPSEKLILRKLWPAATRAAIIDAIPRHHYTAIGKQANMMGLRRLDKATMKSRYRLIRELRAMRLARGISPEVLATVMGAHRVQISKWERGESVPRLATVFDWVEALGCRLEIVKA